MNSAQAARHYALALYEAARDAGKLREVELDMKALSLLCDKMPEVVAWCRDGPVHEESAPAFVRLAFVPYVGPLTARMLVLAAESRLEIIPWLPQAFEKIATTESEKVSVILESAGAPDSELVTRVKQAIEARTGKPAVVTVVTDPSLLAGFRVFWSDRLIDLSARGRWEALRSRLKAGGLR